MPSRPRTDAEDEDDLGPSRADLERFSGVTRPCPACRREVYDDAEVCYHCGELMSGRGQNRPPVWAILAAALALLGFLAVTLMP